MSPQAYKLEDNGSGRFIDCFLRLNPREDSSELILWIGLREISSDCFLRIILRDRCDSLKCDCLDVIPTEWFFRFFDHDGSATGLQIFEQALLGIAPECLLNCFLAQPLFRFWTVWMIMISFPFRLLLNQGVIGSGVCFTVHHWQWSEAVCQTQSHS